MDFEKNPPVFCLSEVNGTVCEHSLIPTFSFARHQVLPRRALPILQRQAERLFTDSGGKNACTFWYLSGYSFHMKALFHSVFVGPSRLPVDAAPRCGLEQAVKWLQAFDLPMGPQAVGVTGAEFWVQVNGFTLLSKRKIHAS